MRTNSKEVRAKLREHITEYYETVEELKSQVEAVKYGDMTDYGAGAYMVDGGCFLIYTGEIIDFLNELGINPSHRIYEAQKSFNLYRHLIAGEIERIIK